MRSQYRRNNALRGAKLRCAGHRFSFNFRHSSHDGTPILLHRAHAKRRSALGFRVLDSASGAQIGGLEGGSSGAQIGAFFAFTFLTCSRTFTISEDNSTPAFSFKISRIHSDNFISAFIAAVSHCVFSDSSTLNVIIFIVYTPVFTTHQNV